MRQRVILIFLLLCAGLVHARPLDLESALSPASALRMPEEQDSLVIKKRFWRASAELMLVQVIPWAYNYYIRDAEFAHISWESIEYNLSFSHWEWDDNNFKTNQFAHPYHGSMYFSAFRTNGYSYWQSAPAAFVGSYIWETFGETHPPAPNDFINTSLGGISLGEMTFRFSNLIVNNRQTGFRRQVNEVLAFIVNPMNGLNRILDGRWGRVHANPADRRPGFLSGHLDVGWRRYSQEVEDVLAKGENEFFARATIQYGNPFEDFEKPFSNFTLIGEIGASDSAFINEVKVAGSLYGRAVRDDEKVKRVMTVTANYDYIHNTAIEFGAQSFTLKWLTDHAYGAKNHVYTEAGVIGVALGAVPDDYLYYGEGRDYDFCMGGGLQLGLKVNLAGWFWFTVQDKAIWMHTVDGNESDFLLNNLVSELRFNASSAFSFGMQIGYITQDGNYADLPDVEKHYPYGRLFAGFRIGSRD